jgi:peptidylprolyl isomerase
VRRLLVVLLVACFAVAGLAGLAGAAAPAALAEVTVSGAAGQKPTVTFTMPFNVTKSAHRQITAGTGTKLAKGDTVHVNLLVLDARTGAELQSSYSSTPAVLQLDPKKTRGAVVSGLVGQSVGARELIAMAPKDGLAASIAAQNSTVQKDDTVLFVVDVIDVVSPPLKRAAGTAVTPPAGLPTAKLASNGKPTIKVPKTAAPTQLVVQPLIKGTGPVVAAGQTITVHYTGVIWDTNKKFDSSWDRKETLQTEIGSGQVIAGWDEGLVGQTVGSQVLLVVPPDKGYGAQGSPPKIKGTDTLVFVVDLLGAA